jgi:predicted acetyltransferase
MDDITIRPVTTDEYPAFVTAFMEGFSSDLQADDQPEHFRHTLPPERTLAAFDGDTIVGTFGGFDLELTVPGGTVKMEGTTVVTVFPTHRRMGLLNAMMSDHLDNAVANGYPVAGLWASESGIYGRHGYGIATYAVTRSMDGSLVRFRDDIHIDRVRRITREQASDVLPSVFDRVLSVTPGMFARNDAWWTHEALLDEDWMKRGRTAKRIVVHDGASGADGYVVYRQKGDEADDGHANGEVSVIELIAATPRAKASLWSYIANIDGCPKVKLWNVAVDDDVMMMVREPRRIRATGIYDALWIRVLDVEVALSCRTYEEDGTFVFSIVDSYRPGTDGSYRLAVSDGVGTCERTNSLAGLDLDVDVLGALYLGGADARAYARAGRIRGSQDDVDRLARMFRTVKAPWCDQVF